MENNMNVTMRIIALLLIVVATAWGGYTWMHLTLDNAIHQANCDVESCKAYIPKDCDFDEVKSELQKICAHCKDGKLFDEYGKSIVFWHYTQFKGGMAPDPEMRHRTLEADRKMLTDLRRKSTVIIYTPMRSKSEYLYPKTRPQ